MMRRLSMAAVVLASTLFVAEGVRRTGRLARADGDSREGAGGVDRRCGRGASKEAGRVRRGGGDTRQGGGDRSKAAGTHGAVSVDVPRARTGCAPADARDDRSRRPRARRAERHGVDRPARRARGGRGGAPVPQGGAGAGGDPRWAGDRFLRRARDRRSAGQARHRRCRQEARRALEEEGAEAPGRDCGYGRLPAAGRRERARFAARRAARRNDREIHRGVPRQRGLGLGLAHSVGQALGQGRSRDPIDGGSRAGRRVRALPWSGAESSVRCAHGGGRPRYADVDSVGPRRGERRGPGRLSTGLRSVSRGTRRADVDSPPASGRA